MDTAWILGSLADTGSLGGLTRDHSQEEEELEELCKEPSLFV